MEASESQRVVCIITYSRADTEKFHRETFGEAIIEAWNSFNIEIPHWVVSMEGHATTDADGDLNKYHFHMAVKLKKRGRWLQVKRYLSQKFHIEVHFSDRHNTYYSAYKYVTKSDLEAVNSVGHPDLTTCPRTENANMMDIRWSFFRFWKPISQSEQREIAPCGHCFARFILENSSNVYIAD